GDTAARNASHAQGHVQGNRSGGDDADAVGVGAFAQTHDRAFAEDLLDLAHRHFDCPRSDALRLCHLASSSSLVSRSPYCTYDQLSSFSALLPLAVYW